MNKARGKSGPVSTFSNLLLFKFVVCSYFPFLVFGIKSGVGGRGGGLAGCFTHVSTSN